MSFFIIITGVDASIGGPCPVSHYCPEGTSFPLACPSGTYMNRTGQSVCDECPASYFCPENTTSYEPFACPVGHYCPNGTQNSNQYPCPMGTYRNYTGGMSEADCFPCPCGEYCGNSGLEYPSGSCNPGRVLIYFIFCVYSPHDPHEKGQLKLDLLTLYSIITPFVTFEIPQGGGGFSHFFFIRRLGPSIYHLPKRYLEY